MHTNAMLLLLLFKTAADESWERGFCIYEQPLWPHTLDQGEGGCLIEEMQIALC